MRVTSTCEAYLLCAYTPCAYAPCAYAPSMAGCEWCTWPTTGRAWASLLVSLLI
jgi:hypothetical protein